MRSNIFGSIKVKAPRYNSFDLSHEKKLTLNMGTLVPVFLQEVVPGDKFRVSSEILMRMAPLIAPVMHRVNVYTHFWFVPNRLVFDDWDKFITGGADGMDSTLFPTININATLGDGGYTAKGTLFDYFGLPVPPTTLDHITNEADINALPFRAYQLIYNEFYRDQNIISPINFSKGSVIDDEEAALIMELRNRAWEKDYLTSALPFVQRGQEVMMPLGITDDNITYLDKSRVVYGTGSNMNGTLAGNISTGVLQDATPNQGRIENIEEISTGGVTINTLRMAVKLQEWLEKNARGGARYIEQILSHFGVRVADYRLQRPEFLGGGRQPVVVSEVLSTVQHDLEDSSIPQANMAGHGISIGKSNSFKKSFAEHGYILGIMSVIPRSAYQQGINRMWTRSDKTEWYWPSFAHLGEQQVRWDELYKDWESAQNDAEAFGYQSRYAEYKYNPDSVHGDFRDSLVYWHLGRVFDSCPVLDAAFIELNGGNESDLTRIFAVTDPNVHHLLVQCYNNVQALRPMPVFGTPSL